MAVSSPVSPRAFSLPGGPQGALLIHGFTGSPAEVRPVGDALAAEGYAVEAPLLPGHGTRYQDLNRVRWLDWLESAEASLDALLARCHPVVVAGLSMGSLLAAYLCAARPAIRGAVLYSPPLRVRNRLLHLAPYGKKIIRSLPKRLDDDLADPGAGDRLWAYRRHPSAGAHELLRLMRATASVLPYVRQPTLVVASRADTTIAPDSANRLYEALGSKEKDLWMLPDRGHCLTVDRGHEEVERRTIDWFRGSHRHL